MVNYKHLHYFWTMARERGVARASDRFVHAKIQPSTGRMIFLTIRAEDQATRDMLLEAIVNGSVVSWQHINLLGEYNFSDEKLQDTVGIKPPRLAA